MIILIIFYFSDHMDLKNSKRCEYWFSTHITTLQDILTFLSTVYLPSTTDPNEVVFNISSLRDETFIKNVTGKVINGKGKSTPLTISTTPTKNKKGEIVKKFELKTRYDFKYEKARTWNLVLKVCFEDELHPSGLMKAAEPWVMNIYFFIQCTNNYNFYMKIRYKFCIKKLKWYQ